MPQQKRRAKREATTARTVLELGKRIGEGRYYYFWTIFGPFFSPFLGYFYRHFAGFFFVMVCEVDCKIEQNDVRAGKNMQTCAKTSSFFFRL